jgi:DHA2 family multidrug resistance protein-like MFS transporter
LGLNAFVIGISAAAAPTIAAAVLSVASWRWLFGINVPFCIFSLIVGAIALPDNSPRPRAFDVPSALISAVMFGALVVGADAVCRDVSSLTGWILLILPAGCAYLLIRRSWSQSAPLFPTDLLRIPLFGLSIATSIACFIAQTTGAVSLPFMLQTGLGRSIVQTGLLFTPWPIASAIAAVLAGILADKVSGAILNSAGLVVMAIGFILLAVMPASIDDIGIIWRIAICGAGFGFFQSPNNRTLVLAAPRARSGATGGALAAARNTGQCLGAVLVVLLFQALPVSSGSRWALTIAGGIALVAAAISGLRFGYAVAPEQKMSGDG